MADIKEYYIRNKKGQFVRGYPHNKGTRRSEITKLKMSKTQKRIGSGKRLVHKNGDRNPNWRGGITTLKDTIRKCFKYRQWRSDIFTRDDFTCQNCNMKGGRIDAHHVKSFGLILRENNIKTSIEALDCEELWNINNGQTLCRECHKKTKNFGGCKKTDLYLNNSFSKK